MRALIAGSVAAAILGVAAGANLKPGVHPDGPDLRGAADSLIQFAAPPAEAAETPDVGDRTSSPALHVMYDGRWVTEDERAALQAQNQAQAGQTVDKTDVIARPLMPAPDQHQGGEPTDPPPPPLIVSLNAP